MKIYTRNGDDGTTSLSGGKRLPKHHPRIEAFGAIDELVAWFGLIKDQKENSSRQEILGFIQEQLMLSASSLALDPDNHDLRPVNPDADCSSKLELEIDEMESRLSPVKSFLVPGGHTAVSYCHIARSVCRRTERSVVRLNETEFVPEIILEFFSGLFFSGDNGGVDKPFLPDPFAQFSQ